MVKPHAEQLHAHNWSIFEFLVPEKNGHGYDQLLQSLAPLLALAKSIY